MDAQRDSGTGETRTMAARDVLGFAARRGWRVQALAGTCLVTQTGDAKDYVLGEGEWFEAARSGRVVLYAVTDAAFRLGV